MTPYFAADDGNFSLNVVYFKIRRLVFLAVSLPLGAFVLCVLISMIKDFDEVNKTHCKVYNFLPSISSAIGNKSPQTYIWRLSVAFHLSPRIILALSYYGLYQQLERCSWKYNSTYRTLCRANLAFHLLEIVCLAGLTFVSSSENFSIHEMSFIGFAVCSWLYMVTACALFRNYTTKKLLTRQLKEVVLSVLCVSILGISYTYWRHNTYCEPYIYSAFAFFEYLVVLCNMAFHTLAAWDFEDHNLLVSARSQQIQDYLL